MAYLSMLRRTVCTKGTMQWARDIDSTISSHATRITVKAG